MTNNELLNINYQLNINIDILNSIKCTKLQFYLSKNIEIIRKEVTFIITNLDKYKSEYLLQPDIDITSEKFKIEENIFRNNENVIEIMNYDIDITFYMLNLEELPIDLDAKQLDLIKFMIK
jgi:hypothetical protein